LFAIKLLKTEKPAFAVMFSKVTSMAILPVWQYCQYGNTPDTGIIRYNVVVLMKAKKKPLRP
jgi:hypothetical protein